MQFIDKYGWPVEIIKDKPITNIIRRLIHTNYISFQILHGYDKHLYCKKKLRISIYRPKFVWIWIGLYLERCKTASENIIYICLLPCLVLKIRFQNRTNEEEHED